MPIYEYRCEGCGHEMDHFHRSRSEPKPVCAACGEDLLERLMSLSAFHLKGNGWYADSYGADKKQTNNGQSEGQNADATASSDGAAGEKADATPAASSGESTGAESTAGQSTGEKSTGEKSAQNETSAGSSKSDSGAATSTKNKDAA